LYENTSRNPNKENIDNKFTCALCGKMFEKNKSILEEIDGYQYLFDSKVCISMFKRLANLYGNEFKNFIGDEQYISDVFWDKVIPKEQEFDDELGSTNETFKIIKDPVQVQELAFHLGESSNSEILILFSTANAFHRQERMGALVKLQEIRENNDKIKIRILTPFDEDIHSISKKLKNELNIEMMNLREPSRIRASVLLVDRKVALYVELKDDTKYTSYEAIGLSIFSSISSTVISYVTIFETMWKQEQVYQELSKLQKQVKSQKVINMELNNTIADLKHSIKPIVALSKVMRSKKFDSEDQDKFVDIITKNARKLEKIVDDV
jgi:hypothetical protein